MTEVDVSFLAILSNVDDSFRSIEFEQGFHVHRYTLDEIAPIISVLENDTIDKTKARLRRYHCIYQDFAYCIENSLVIDTDVTEGLITGNTVALAGFYSSEYRSYLLPLIRKMRLYKEGNIWMPLKYFYYSPDADSIRSLFRAGTDLHITPSLFTLNQQEIAGLNDFIKGFQIPFEKKYLQLAFENFEWSFHLHEQSLQFLSLMMGIEILFNPGQTELKYRVSRNLAVFIGDTPEDSTTKFERMKTLYNKRSSLVHNGEIRDFDISDLHISRDYLRKSINKMNVFNQDKDDILNLINSRGFGSM